LDGS
jgi:hypothetical protein